MIILSAGMQVATPQALIGAAAPAFTLTDSNGRNLRWSAQDLFGLAAVPERPSPNYRRLSRYDQTGLIWLLQGRPVVTLTQTTAAIANSTSAITIYRKHNKLALAQ
jgi:hypothetical protein